MNKNENEFYSMDKDSKAEENSEVYAYKNVMTEKGNTRLFSVIALVCAGLSVIFFFIPWLGIIFGIASIGVSLVSRRQLGYFEVLAIIALIMGIFGFVFSLTGIILGAVTANSGYFNFWSLLFGGKLM